MTALAKLQARLQARAASNSAPLSEAARVCALPLRAKKPFSVKQFRRVTHPEIIPWDIQNNALAEIRDCGGGLFPIGCGNGKTIIALFAGTVLDCDVTVVFCPASCVPQMQAEALKLQRDYRIKPLHILSYATLSRAGGTDILDKLTKDISAERICIVADEAHRLKMGSVRTGRLARWFFDHEAAHFVALSGTLTARSLHDFAHLSELALRHRSPLPREDSLLGAWARCVDVQGEAVEIDWMQMRGLWRWFRENANKKDRARFAYELNHEIDHAFIAPGRRREMARVAFQRRLQVSAGVIASKANVVKASLLIKAKPYSGTLPPNVVAALRRANGENEAPNGDVFTDPVDKWRTLREISCGFFYIWDWRDAIVDYDWLEARNGWRRAVAWEIETRGGRGYDSPALVRAAVESEIASLPASRWRNVHRAWNFWDGQRHKEKPPTKAIWLSDYLVREAVEWAASAQHPVIVWYQSAAMRDALARAGAFPVYGAGDDVAAMLAKKAPHTCAMGIAAQGTGLNLHGWSEALVIEPPPGGKVWEQLISRLHRQRQKADEVVWHYFAHTAAFRNALKTAQRDARYIEDTSGNRQRLNMAVFVDG